MSVAQGGVAQAEGVPLMIIYIVIIIIFFVFVLHRQGCASDNQHHHHHGHGHRHQNPHHCYIKCPFLGLGACFGQFSSNDISFHHELMFAMGLEF